jgi:hypothetical protein
MKLALSFLLTLLVTSGDAFAQARGGRGAAAARPARTTSVRLVVHSQDGASLDGVKVTLSGGTTAEFTTAGAGMVIVPNLADGNYRARFERDGYVPFEREFTVRAGTPTMVEVTMTPLPPPPPPPPPPPAPAAKAVPASGSPVNVSVVDFLDKNFIGREPLKESVLACKPLETVRLLQLREALAPHSHADADEVVYVVAGEGSARIGEQVMPLKPGTMVVVPHATAHSFEHRGKNPLMLLSTLSGAPCDAANASK